MSIQASTGCHYVTYSVRASARASCHDQFLTQGAIIAHVGTRLVGDISSLAAGPTGNGASLRTGRGDEVCAAFLLRYLACGLSMFSRNQGASIVI